MPEGSKPQSTPPGPPAWSRLHLWQIQWVRDVLIVLLVLSLFWLGQTISVVTVPLLLALLLAYLFEPVIQWLMRRFNLQRQGAAAAIIAAVVLGIVIPATLGITYGSFQAIGILIKIAGKTEVVWTSVDAGREATTAAEVLAEAKRLRSKAGLDAEGDDAGGREQDAPGTPPDEVEPHGAPAGSPAERGDATSPPSSEGGGAAGDGGASPAGPSAFDRVLAFLKGESDEPIDPPTPEEIAGLEAKAAQARQTAREKRKAVDEQAPRWLKLNDFLVARSEEGSFDEAFQTIQRWLRANAEQVAGTAATAGANIAHTTVRFLAGTFGLLFMLFLTAFFFFFMSTGWVEVKDFAAKLLPERNKDLVLHLLTEFDRVISAFIRGRLTIAFIQSIVFTIGYFLIGVPAAFILGPIIAILSIVPYLALVGLPIAILLLWVENHTGFRGHWLWILGAPTAFYFFAQALDDYVWTPWIQGKSTDMSTPMILFASLAGGVLFGVFGLLIAIPIAACIKILIQEVFWPHFKRWTDGEEEDFLPIARERKRT